MEKLLYSAKVRRETGVMVSWWDSGKCRRHQLITTNHVLSGEPLATIPVTTTVDYMDWNENEFETKVFPEQNVWLDREGKTHVG